MADRRRRRKATGSGDSDEVTESSEDGNPEEKRQEQEGFVELSPEKVTLESEYESAEEEDEEEGESDVNHTQDVGDPDAENPADEEGGQEETAEVLDDDYVESGGEWKDEQREEGDGEESEIEHSKEKSLDFDEDRRNPQYIPKKGGFYEHDDRLNESAVVEESEKTPEDTEKKKNVMKKLWKDEGKWIHDRYHETEQNPKSTNELVNIYGYDIRNEEGPPHARRRRRYGRGPSKYTRKWEDEDAYNISISVRGKEGENFRRGTFRGRRGIRSRGGNQTRQQKKNVDREVKLDQNDFPLLESKTVETATTIVDRNDLNGEEKHQKKSENDESLNYKDESSSRKKDSQEINRRRPIRGRNRFGRVPWNKFTSTKSDNANFKRNQMSELTDNMKELHCSDNTETNVDYTAQNNDRRKGTRGAANQQVINSSTFERRQGSIPPRLQDAAANKPKRYSSQRQRTAPEPGGCFQQNSTNADSSMPMRYYDQCYQQPVYSDRSNSSRNQTGNTLIANQSYQGYEPSSYQDSYGIRTITNSPRMFSPVSLPAGQPVMSASYVASGGNLIGYGSPQSAFTQYPFQPYASSSATPAVGDPHDNTLTAMHSSPPQEIFRGGMAYYNTQPPVRTVPKRPRAAIPIVPPPEMEGNVRSSNEDLTEENESKEMMENENEGGVLVGQN